MPKRKLYGDLSTHHVRLIRKYLKALYDPNVPQTTMTSTLFAWTDIIMGADGMAASRLQTVGLAGGTAKALRAGLEVMKHERVGCIWDWSPGQAFATLGSLRPVRLEGCHDRWRLRWVPSAPRGIGPKPPPMTSKGSVKASARV
jgi:hypothetical protein